MNCEKCKELLVAYVEELLEEPGKQSVAEHLKDCPSCQSQLTELRGLHDRLVKNGKALARGDLENDVMNRIVREQNVRLKATGGPRPTLQIRRILMKSPMTRIAAAAALIVVAALGINYIMAPSVTWAQVIGPILNARTIVFDVIIGTDESGPVMHEIVSGSRIRRTMSNLPGLVMIIDLDGGQMLALDTAGKTGSYVKIGGFVQEGTQNYIQFVRQIIRQVPDGKVEELGEQIIDGKKAIGFIGKGQNEAVTIWADPETGLPIRVEARIGKEFPFVMKNFQFDAPVEDSVISMDLPAGYTEEKATADLTDVNEKDLVESLRIFAEIMGDGVFPEAVGTETTMKRSPEMVEKAQQKGISEEEIGQLGTQMGRGMIFHQMLEVQGQWHYAGAGVKLGDAAKAIFWYLPEGAGTYRVIYGDLSVKDVAPEDLPK